LIAGAADIARRKRFLILSITINLTFLGFFKYFDFFVDSFLSAAASMGIHNLSAPLIRVLLPPGISFYTFQEIAYIVDVASRKAGAITLLRGICFVCKPIPTSHCRAHPAA
jgi:D-alanyl-lipoteichoic acid acyltransferase DltB (MBOAT superfamily)